MPKKLSSIRMSEECAQRIGFLCQEYNLSRTDIIEWSIYELWREQLRKARMSNTIVHHTCDNPLCLNVAHMKLKPIKKEEDR